MSQNLPHRDDKIKARNGCTRHKVLPGLLAGAVGVALSASAMAQPSCSNTSRGWI